MMKILYLTLILASASVALAQSERSLIRDGNRQYDQKKYTDAEVNYRKALEKDKDLSAGSFNLGDAIYKQDRFEEAVREYQAAARNGGAPEKSHALYNLGNALLKGQKIPESIAAYKEALKLSPSDADAKYNLEYAKTLLQKQQQKQQNQKNDKKQDQQKQDQQKQDQQKQDQQKQDQQKQDQQKQDQQKQAPMRKQQLSKQDAERILEALKNQEKEVQKKLHRKVPAKIKVEKDW